MRDEYKFAIIVCLIVGSLLAGYLARRLQLLKEQFAEVLMTLVAVFGYSSVDLFTVWGNPPPDGFWLPVMAACQLCIMCLLGVIVARPIARNRAERGLMCMASGAGNNGFTMGGFVIYLLYGTPGLALVTMYGLAWTPTTVLVLYPIARHFASQEPSIGLGRLMLRSVFNWRAGGLLISLTGVTLGYSHVPQPLQVKSWHIIDILMFTVTPMAYFAVGLRLHVSQMWPMKRIFATVAAMRFGVGLAVGLGMVAVVALTSWPLSDLARNVFVVEAFVPTAVSMVAVANMFNLIPRQASALFLVNTMTYLVIVLPFVLKYFGG